MTVKFTKAGTYKVYCDLHPGMEAIVTVAKKGAAVPTAKQDAAAVKKQADAAVKAAKGLETTRTRAPTPSTSAWPPRAASSTSAWSRRASPSRRARP